MPWNSLFTVAKQAWAPKKGEAGFVTGARGVIKTTLGHLYQSPAEAGYTTPAAVPSAVPNDVAAGL
jgi:hypothetical protein